MRGLGNDRSIKFELDMRTWIEKEFIRPVGSITWIEYYLDMPAFNYL